MTFVKSEFYNMIVSSSLQYELLDGKFIIANRAPNDTTQTLLFFYELFNIQFSSRHATVCSSFFNLLFFIFYFYCKFLNRLASLVKLPKATRAKVDQRHLANICKMSIPLSLVLLLQNQRFLSTNRKTLPL